MSLANLFWPVVVLGGASALWYALRRARQSSGAPLPAIATPSGNVPNLPVSAHDKPAFDRVPVIAERITTLWSKATGDNDPPPMGARQLALAQAWLESGVAVWKGGGWWEDKTSKGSGNMQGSGNLGGSQCTSSENGGSDYHCEPYEDSHPDGKKYSTRFRYYTSQDAAVLDFLKQIATPKTFLRDKAIPQSGTMLRKGDLDGYARGLYNQHYYEGFGKTDEERIAGYKKSLADHIPLIAQALHEPIAVIGLSDSGKLIA